MLSKNWEDLKKVNLIYHRILRNLFVTPPNCLLYDNRLVFPKKLKQMVQESNRHKHPGQVVMLALAKLLWRPHIHSEIIPKAKACKYCTEKGKNLTVLLPENQLGSLPELVEPRNPNGL